MALPVRCPVMTARVPVVTSLLFFLIWPVSVLLQISTGVFFFVFVFAKLRQSSPSTLTSSSSVVQLAVTLRHFKYLQLKKTKKQKN